MVFGKLNATGDSSSSQSIESRYRCRAFLDDHEEVGRCYFESPVRQKQAIAPAVLAAARSFMVWARRGSMQTTDRPRRSAPL